MRKEKHPSPNDFDPNDNPYPILRFDLNAELLYHNQAAEPLVVFWQLEKKKRLPQACHHALREAIRQKKTIEIEVLFHAICYLLKFCPFPTKGYVDVYGFDVSTHKALQKQIFELSYFDALTQLPNRRQLLAYLAEQLAEIPEESTAYRLALLLIDVRDFKLINHALGHRVGDAVLKAIADRLTACVPKQYFLTRLSGDEFVVLNPELTSIADTAELAETILDNFREPFSILENDIHITLSIGIAIAPHDAVQSGQLIRSASMALSRSKRRGYHHYEFFHADMRVTASAKHHLLSDMRKALTEEQFVLYYQPQFDLKTGEFVSVEALVRWQHPTHGLLTPERFAQLAEESGLIVEMGSWILEKTCQQISTWIKKEYPAIKVAVNVSYSQFLKIDLVKQIEKLLKKYQIPPACLELEITENVLIADMARTKKIIDDLNHLGIQISIDDFGTGYSAFSYLKDLSVHQIKIDRSFLTDVLATKKTQIILNGMIKLAHQLQLSVLVEGIENKKQFNFLKRAQADRGQGYYFSQALSVVDIESWFTSKGKPV